MARMRCLPLGESWTDSLLASRLGASPLGRMGTRAPTSRTKVPRGARTRATVEGITRRCRPASDRGRRAAPGRAPRTLQPARPSASCPSGVGEDAGRCAGCRRGARPGAARPGGAGGRRGRRPPSPAPRPAPSATLGEVGVLAAVADVVLAEPADAAPGRGASAKDSDQNRSGSAPRSRSPRRGRGPRRVRVVERARGGRGRSRRRAAGGR